MDPNTVTILRNPNAQKKKTVKELSNKSANSQYNGNIKKLENEEIPKLDVVGKDTGMKISQARLAKGFKQKDVANHMNMDTSLYQKYENGTATRNGQIQKKLGKYI